MKASEPGRVIGIALQGFDGAAKDDKGTVLLFVNPSWWNGPMPVGGSTAGSGLSITQDSLLDFKNSTLSGVAAIISTNGTWSITADGYLSVAKVDAKNVTTENLTVKADAGATDRVVGVGRLQAGYDATLIQNPNVKPDSVIVVTFEGNPGSSWWISEKQDGQFMLHLAAPTTGDISFTYWIVPIDGVLDPTAASNTQETSATTTTATSQLPPPTDSGSSTPTDSGTSTPTDSGTSTTP